MNRYLSFISQLIIYFILVPVFIFSENYTDSWPISRGNQQLTGVISTKLANKFKLLWSFKTGDEIHSSPVINGDRLYIGSDDGILYCLELETGKKIWGFETEDSIEAPPLLAFGKLYFGTLGGLFYALDPGLGKLLWQVDTKGQISGSANWMVDEQNRKLIITGNYDNSLYAFDGESGKIIWIYKALNYINGAPSIWKNNIVFGGCDAQLRLISGNTGAEIFHIDLGSYIPGSAAVKDDYCYAGHYGNKLVCVNLQNQVLAWEFFSSEKGAFFSSPAISGDLVVAGARDGYLYCLDRLTGKKVWAYKTKNEIDCSPVISGDNVVFSSGDGKIYILRLADGKLVWSYEIGSPVTGSPAVFNGMLFLGALDNRVYAFTAR